MECNAFTLTVQTGPGGGRGGGGEGHGTAFVILSLLCAYGGGELVCVSACN